MLEILSALINLLWVVVPALVIGGVIYFGRSLRRSQQRASHKWSAYTRTINTLSRTGEKVLEIGVRRGTERMALDSITAAEVSQNSEALYLLQAKADETAATLNARADQNDYYEQ